MLGLGQASALQGLEAARPKIGIGAKSLDSSLGSVHTWSHSHYLMLQCDGLGEWKSAAKLGAGAKSII